VRSTRPFRLAGELVCSYAMPKQIYTAAEAARALGISLDTLRRWDREGRIRTRRDRGNRRLVPSSEIDRLRGGSEPQVLSARNRFRGIVQDVEVDGLLAKVEIEVTEPARVVAVITRDSAEALGLKPGMTATGIVKATSVMVER
jgi:molybdopterin-binding protein